MSEHGREDVRFTIDGAVGRISLIRSDARNAIDPRWVEALRSAVIACAAEPGIRAALLTAEGPAFSVGGDLNDFAANIDRVSQQLDEMITPFHEALLALAELPVPVVCAAQGAIAGGGLGLLWCSDVVLLADNAKLAPAFHRLGLNGDGGSSWYLPRLLGMRRAFQLIMLGRVLNAEEAVAWDLADRVVPSAQLELEGLAAARSLASGPTLAYAQMRQLIRGAFDRSLQEALQAELDAIVALGATADGREGILSFAERREPRFEGR